MSERTVDADSLVIFIFTFACYVGIAIGAVWAYVPHDSISTRWIGFLSGVITLGILVFFCYVVPAAIRKGKSTVETTAPQVKDDRIDKLTGVVETLSSRVGQMTAYGGTFGYGPTGYDDNVVPPTGQPPGRGPPGRSS